MKLSSLFGRSNGHAPLAEMERTIAGLEARLAAGQAEAAALQADLDAIRSACLPPLSDAQKCRLFDLCGLLRHRGWSNAADGILRAYGLPALTTEPEVSWYGAVAGLPERLVGVIGDSVVSTLHFRPLATREEARIAFGHGVRIIDMEIFSQCNRRCHYCTNSVIDRYSRNEFMDPAVYRRILDDLREIQWDGNFRFIGLNEPLMHRECMLERLVEARYALPKALLTVYTNGDHLTPDYLEALYQAGLRALYVSVHLGPGEPFDDDKILRRIHQFGQRLRVEARLTNHVPGRFIEAKVMYKDMLATMFQYDYAAVGHDRGGILTDIGPPDINRTAACSTPIQMMVVGYNGNVLPCCHFVGDAEQHLHLVMGKMTPETSIFDIYGSAAYAAWRVEMFTLGSKRVECRKCVDYADSPMHNDAVLIASAERLAGGSASHACYLGSCCGEALEGIRSVAN